MKKLRTNKMNKLLKVYCKGNYNLFSRELGANPGHLYRFLNTEVGGW